MPEKVLTIIIPHYNTPDYLERLLISIPVKKEIQIVVVDDKSNTDMHKYIKLKESYKHVEFFDNETEKKGAGVCRNIGLTHAIADWLLFADADDYFVEDFYEVAERYFHSANDVVYFAPTSIDQETNRVSIRHLYYYEIVNNYVKKSNKTNELYLRYTYFGPWSKLIRRSFIEDNRILFEEVIVGNDTMFSTMVGYFMQTFQATNEIIYCVVNNKDTLTKKISEENFYIRFDCFVRRCLFIRSVNSKKDYKIVCSNVNFLGIKQVHDAIIYKLGIKNILDICKVMRKNNIGLFHIKYLNPITFTKYLIHSLKRDVANKRHYNYEMIESKDYEVK